MRIRDTHFEGEEPYNLVPLTDMVFNLLIFFMCATTFVQIEKDMALQLPQAGKASGLAPGASVDQLIVNIRQDGTRVIAGKTYPPKDENALFDRIIEELHRRGGTAVIIRTDQRSIVKYFADVARICRRAGVKDVKLVYVESSGEKSD